MGDDLVDVVTSLSGDLDAAARRRLWLVGQIIGRSSVSELESALEAVAKIDMFIARGCRNGSIATSGNQPAPFIDGSTPNDDDPADLPSEQRSAAPTASLDSQRATALSERHRVAQRPLLDSQTREVFIREAAKNSDNRHLAQVFGLSVRQAHAIRVGLRKFIPQARNGHTPNNGPTRNNVSKFRRKENKTPVNRETELKMQQDFLRTRPPALPTIEDVVRYLRQAGDVVVLDGQNYSVNYDLTLTVDELVERANAKRRVRQQPPFELTNVVAGAAPDGMAEAAPESDHARS
jgi:hypothetical protein